MHPLQLVLASLGVLALGLFLAGWAAYPVALALLRPRRRAELASTQPEKLPPIAVIIATREPAAAVVSRVEDLLRGDYPVEKVRVVVAVDARSSVPPSEVAAALNGIPAATVVPGDPPGGKAAALNAAVRAAEADLLVFTDTAQRFAPGAVARLIGCLLQSGAFGASGYLRARGNRGLLGRFWDYETMVRRLESEVDSLVGVTGALYALRREAWHDLRPGVINDDLLVPLQARKAGHRVVQCSEAEVLDERQFSREDQYQRRVRTLTGVYQLLAWYPWIGSPAGNPLWTQFLLHKVVRLATPFLLGLVGMAIVSAVRWSVLLGGTAAIVAVGAVLGILRHRSPAAVLVDLGWAVRLLLAAPVAAAANAWRGDWDVWRTSPGPARTG